MSRFAGEFRYKVDQRFTPSWSMVMAKRSLRLLLLVFAALGVACGDGGFEPVPRAFTSLSFAPNDAVLFTGAERNTIRSSVLAYDQWGSPMQGTGAATYSSSAPGIATVSSEGVVTAAGPGTAEITATLTLGGVTRTASMTVTVFGIAYSDVGGVYDLTALITTFDPASLVDLTGYRYTATFTLWEGWDPPWLWDGMFEDLRLIGPGGDTVNVAKTGFITTSFDSHGRLVIQLYGDGNQVVVTLRPATLASESLDGGFGCCGHISGTFTARRRPPQ